MRTVIGIVGKHINDNKIRTDTLIRDEVKQAIFDNGAIAIGILSPNGCLFLCIPLIIPFFRIMPA